MMTFEAWLEFIGRPKATETTEIEVSWTVGGMTGGSC